MHWRIQGIRGSGPPFLAHYVGFLTLGPQLDPLFLLVNLRWTPPPFEKSWIRPCNASRPIPIVYVSLCILEQPGCRMDHVEILSGRLSIDDASSKVTSPTSGAVSIFVGALYDRILSFFLKSMYPVCVSWQIMVDCHPNTFYANAALTQLRPNLSSHIVSDTGIRPAFKKIHALFE